MRIIGQNTLVNFWSNHPEVEISLQRWYRLARASPRSDVEEWLAEKSREAIKLQLNILWWAKPAFWVGVTSILVTLAITVRFYPICSRSIEGLAYTIVIVLITAFRLDDAEAHGGREVVRRGRLFALRTTHSARGCAVASREA
jgi:hypothetical protein